MMTVNLVELLKTDNLTSEDKAQVLVENLSVLDLLKIGQIAISFNGVKLVNMDFLIPFMRFLHTIDMQDVDDKVKVTLKHTTTLQETLIVEAYRTVREEEKRVRKEKAR